jgi:hypothetical protein
VNGYDPDRDGELLPARDVCALLHVSRSHLPNLRANGTLRGFKLHTRGDWKYPSNQPTLAAARAALQRATLDSIRAAAPLEDTAP